MDEPVNITRELIVPNELGLHARAASKLARLCMQFTANIEVESQQKRRANAKSVIDLLTLGAEKGHTLQVTSAGHDAEDAMRAIVDLFSKNLGE